MLKPTLDWIGKDRVVNNGNEARFRPLEHMPEPSAGAPGTVNMLIEGDNAGTENIVLVL